MAIKVTHRGTKPADRPYRGTCTACRTSIECVQADGQMSYDRRDGDALKVPCPVCGQSIWCSPGRAALSSGLSADTAQRESE